MGGEPGSAAGGGRVFEARERRFGGCFEDFEVGDEYRHWPGKTITEAESHLFCMLTLSVHPLHVDSAHFDGTQGPFERPVVAGPHIYSLLLGMSVPGHLGAGAGEPGHHRPAPHRAGVSRRHALRHQHRARDRAPAGRAPTPASSPSRPWAGIRTARW